MRRLSQSARLLLSATFISNVAMGMHTLVVGKVLYDHTGSAAAFGVVIVLEYLVAFSFQLLAGPWVDRGDPKWISAGASVLRGSFILLASTMLASPQQTVWIIATSLVIQAAKPFYRAAQFALIPAIVVSSDLTRINSYNSISLQAGQLIGVGLVGPVVAFGGTALAFVFNGTSFLLAALAVTLISASIPHAALTRGDKARRWLLTLSADWISALKVLYSNPALAWLVVLCAGDFLLVGLVNLVLAPIVAARFDGSAYWLSMLDGSFAFGAILTAFFVDALARRLGQRMTVLLGLGGQVLSFLLLAFNGSGIGSLGCMFAIGSANAASSMVLLTALQQRAVPAFRGRIVSMRNLVVAAAGGGVMPIISRLETHSLSSALMACAVVAVLFWLIAYGIDHPNRRGSAMLDHRMTASPSVAVE